MSDSGMRNDHSRSTVLRAVLLLQTFRSADVGLSLRELAWRAELPMTTTHRIVGDLVEAGLLDRADDGYRLGVRLFELGQLVPGQRRLADVALPYLQDLREQTGLTVNLAVPDEGQVVYVVKLPQRGIKVPHSRIGGRLPMHCTGLGKAMLAFSEPELLEVSLSSAPRRLRGGVRSGTPAQLRRELAEVTRTRIAFDNEESEPGLFCAASPVFGPAGLIGALSVTGATQRRQTRHLAPAVIAVAMAVSRAMGEPRRTPLSPQHATDPRTDVSA
jgi:IclR family transcriptional regulator, acetate operon repressor